MLAEDIDRKEEEAEEVKEEREIKYVASSDRL